MLSYTKKEVFIYSVFESVKVKSKGTFGISSRKYFKKKEGVSDVT